MDNSTIMPNSNKILRGYIIKFSEYDNSNTPYYFTLKYGYKGSDTPHLLIDYKTTGATGVDVFNDNLEAARRYNADFVTIREYSSGKKGASSVNGQKGEKISLEINPPTVQNKNYFKELDNIDGQFKGFGGFDGYMNTQRQMMNSDYELMTTKKDNEKLEREISEYKIKIKELEDERKELYIANDDFSRDNERLKKYDPENFEKMGIGFNPITIGGEMLGEGIKNALLNSKLASKLSGLSGLKDKEEESEKHQQQDSQPVQEAQSVHPSAQYDSEDLSPEQRAHLDVVNMIYNWLASIKTGNLKKIQQVLNYFYDKEHGVNEENINLIIELITNSKNPEDNE